MPVFKDLTTAVVSGDALDAADQAALAAAQKKLNDDTNLDVAAHQALSDALDPSKGGPGYLVSVSADGLSATLFIFGSPLVVKTIPTDAAAVPTPTPTPAPAPGP